MTKPSKDKVTLESLPKLLENDTKVKLAGVDADGILRGKLISKKKFLDIATKGFAFSSAIFSWDIHDQVYSEDLKIGTISSGSYDYLACPDLDSFRRIPWEDDVPFFLVSFFEPSTSRPLNKCPRNLLKAAVNELETVGFRALAGIEYEFMQFRAPQTDSSSPTNQKSQQPSVAKFLQDNSVTSLQYLTEGMFGYSLTRPVHNNEYYYDIFNTCEKFNCELESLHTESGPGVFEAALSYGNVEQMADKASLFKYAVKSIAVKYGVTPCFMAKPRQGIPGCSAHIHISIVDKDGKNAFFREQKDEDAKYAEIAHLSDTGRHFLAGVLEGISDVLPIFAPTINSYKRLVENFWAPVTVSWGSDNRLASIRLITPPTCKPTATRIEVRLAGADANPFYVLAVIIALGYRGIKNKAEIPLPPIATGNNAGEPLNQGIRFARTLREANDRFIRKESVARKILGDEFVDYFGATREHEIRLWDQAVTDWEVRRYIETI